MDSRLLNLWKSLELQAPAFCLGSREALPRLLDLHQGQGPLEGVPVLLQKVGIFEVFVNSTVNIESSQSSQSQSQSVYLHLGLGEHQLPLKPRRKGSPVATNVQSMDRDPFRISLSRKMANIETSKHPLSISTISHILQELKHT